MKDFGLRIESRTDHSCYLKFTQPVGEKDCLDLLGQMIKLSIEMPSAGEPYRSRAFRVDISTSYDQTYFLEDSTYGGIALQHLGEPTILRAHTWFCSESLCLIAGQMHNFLVEGKHRG